MEICVALINSVIKSELVIQLSVATSQINIYFN